MASITTYVDKPANDTQAQQTFPCYDYEGDISPKYDLTGPLVPVAIESGCVLTLPTNPYPSTNTSYEGSFVLLAREQMESHLCVHAGQALDDLSHVISRLSELGYPPVRVAVIAANSDSNQNFGSSDEEYFFDYESVKPAHVAFSLVGRDTARHLWSASTLAGPFIVRVVQDQGIWNRDRHSVWNKFRTALAWSSLVPLMVVGVVLIVQSIRVTGRWFSVQVFIFTGALMYLAGGLIAPISTTQNRAQVYCRYIAWMAGYICYSWVLLSWAVIIKKTQSPRFLKAIWAASYLGMAVMFFYAILNITLTIYPTTPGHQLKKWSSFIILPLTMLIQGVVLFFYGMRFLMFIKDSILFANIRVALRKVNYQLTP
ncbi:hypothetical protein IWQ60_001938 [Tieghemiomyces parasiticus]|uniref:Uncharacterized protein n=1 Tax=Tieghemiomyces parasiticus TaxID=78921 RepID=A0A9W8DW50_9FUNG|nr:hypothetical protein IWQ60_001938 [Tieghemiomyces parasiticus]